MRQQVGTFWRSLSTRGKAGVVVVALIGIGAIGSAGSSTPSSAHSSPTPGVIAQASSAPSAVSSPAFRPLSILSPSDGSVVDNPQLVVTGVAPAGGDVTLDIVSAFDQHATADALGNWTMNVTLVPGANTLKFRVGNDALTAITITVTLVAAGTEAPVITEEPATPEPPTPAPTLELAFNPIKLTGHGTKVVKFNIPEDEPAIAVISEKGTSNFVVWTYDSSGSENDLLVNTIGNYSGTRLFDMDQGQHSVAFKVESNGSWTITIKPIELAKLWTPTTSATGKGDMVLQVYPTIDGLAVSTASHKGSENFVIWGYSDSGRDLLVNEIGSYKGDVLWGSGTFLVEIEADGTWTITAPS